jgi:acyl carrier protein
VEAQFLADLAQALELKSNEKIKINDELADFPTWDSIGFLRVTQMLETKYRALVTADVLAEFKSVVDIYNFVLKKS